jgi:regulator of protease activity HflC (stomatin/prohibitin superfamily)
VDFLILILLVLFAVLIVRYGVRMATIYDYENGVRYSRGKFSGVLGPGQYWYLPYFTTITKVDLRFRTETIPGQEVLSSDSVGLKISLAVTFRISESDKAINRVQDYQSALYLELQVALRNVIGSETVDDLLERRDQLGARMKETTIDKIHELGIQLESVNIKDIMFPGALKAIFTQVIKAKKEGLAALEKARGETAALRNLANAAQMVQKNPALLQLRALQSSSGNTVLMGMPSQVGMMPLPQGDQEKSDPHGAEPSSAD